MKVIIFQCLLIFFQENVGDDAQSPMVVQILMLAIFETSIGKKLDLFNLIVKTIYRTFITL